MVASLLELAAARHAAAFRVQGESHGTRAPVLATQRRADTLVVGATSSLADLAWVIERAAPPVENPVGLRVVTTLLCVTQWRRSAIGSPRRVSKLPCA